MASETTRFDFVESTASDPSFAARLRAIVRERGRERAVTIGDESVDFDGLDRWSNRLARRLLELGAKVGDLVTIAEPNSIEFLAATLACWKIGATPQPVSSRLPEVELAALLELARPAVLVGLERPDRVSLPRGYHPSADLDDGPLPDAVSPSWKAPTSGGSTGRPKLIVAGDPSRWLDSHAALAELVGARAGGTMVMPGPLYHNGPFIWASLALLAGAHVVVLPRFDALATLDAVAAHRASALYLVPTMMQRIWRLDPAERLARDVSTLERVWHLGAPCPEWLKDAWLHWLGPEVLWELYGGTEGQAATVINGRDWLAHRGSVGQPMTGEIRIQDDAGNVLPAGEIGEVWLRRTGRDTPTYRYIGASAEERDGWECLGDVGRLDAEGYLYLADRRSDMILVGGANVYPAEVEAAIDAHPAVRSSAVVGLPDDDLGNRVHAIVQAEDLDAERLLAFLGDRLTRYKLPRTIEFVAEALRDDAGKVRRSALRAARL